MDGTGGQDARLAQGEARALYGDVRVPAASIAGALGLTMPAFYRLVRRENWPRRRRGKRAAPAAAAEPARASAPVDRRGMALRLERLVAHRLAAIETEPIEGAADAERQARTLNQLTRTAASIRDYIETLDREETDDDIAPPRSLAELRDELRRHLERVRLEERSRAVPALPDEA